MSICKCIVNPPIQARSQALEGMKEPSPNTATLWSGVDKISRVGECADLLSSRGAGARTYGVPEAPLLAGETTLTRVSA